MPMAEKSNGLEKRASLAWSAASTDSSELGTEVCMGDPEYRRPLRTPHEGNACLGHSFRPLRKTLMLNACFARQIHRESPQPMPSLVVLPRHGRERRRPMARRKVLQHGYSAIIRFQAMRDALQHPSATQVKTVDVRKLRVGAIGHHRRFQPRRSRLARDPRFAPNPRQKPRQPAAKLSATFDPAHEIRLRQTGRQEILARRLIIDRAI